MSFHRIVGPFVLAVVGFSSCGDENDRTSSSPSTPGSNAGAEVTSLPTPSDVDDADSEASTVTGGPAITSYSGDEGPPQLISDRTKEPLGIDSVEIANVKDVSDKFFVPVGLPEPLGMYTVPGDTLVALVYQANGGTFILQERPALDLPNYAVDPFEIDGGPGQPTQLFDSIELPIGPALREVVKHPDGTQTVNMFFEMRGLSIVLESVDASVSPSQMVEFAREVADG